jgi:hypothetical protein
MQQVFKDQALFVAVDAHSFANVLAALGSGVAGQVAYYGTELEYIGFGEDDHPTAPGLHVWEGRLEGGDGVPCAWHGTWRPAKFSDFSRFGLTPPAVTLFEISWSTE